jgi:hypothetical protein
MLRSFHFSGALVITSRQRGLLNMLDCRLQNSAISASSVQKLYAAWAVFWRTPEGLVKRAEPNGRAKRAQPNGQAKGAPTTSQSQGAPPTSQAKGPQPKHGHQAKGAEPSAQAKGAQSR